MELFWNNFWIPLTEQEQEVRNLVSVLTYFPGDRWILVGVAACSYVCKCEACDCLGASEVPKGPSGHGLSARTCFTDPAREQGSWGKLRESQPWSLEISLGIGQGWGHYPVGKGLAMSQQRLELRPVPAVQLQLGGKGGRPYQVHLLQKQFSPRLLSSSFPAEPRPANVQKWGDVHKDIEIAFQSSKFYSNAKI